MNQTVPISVLVPLRWKCLGLVVIVGVILGIVGLGALLGAKALLDWLRTALA